MEKISELVNRDELLNNAQTFFYNMFLDKAKKYKKKSYSSFKINPFTIQATTSALSKSFDAESMAKAVVYPFVLGTSMATSFGTNVQKFIVDSLNIDTVTPSVISGMDIEYIDSVDHRKKYCQLKSGPSTINKDDIETIENYFLGLWNLARTNHLQIQVGDTVVGVLYGDFADLNTMYKRIYSDGYTVLAGNDFWFHLTGLKDLYDDLILRAQAAAKDANWKDSVDSLIRNVEQGLIEDKDLYGF